jgi:PAS domain S-box-containing protein
MDACLMMDTATVSAINQRIFDTSLDLILVVDRRGKLLRVSPSSAAIVGYRPEEMIGRIGAEFVFPDDLDNTRKEMRSARRGREMRSFDCRYVHKSGRPVPISWTGVWADAEQQHFFIGRDMTRRLRLEAELRQAQKMEAIGQLTGGVAHDFNNSLTIIMGTTEVLAAEFGNNPTVAEIVKTIDDAAERCALLTQQMLAFARKQPLQPQRLGLNAIVARLANVLTRMLGEDITVKISLAHDLWSALADPSQVENAILNLAVNARDAMPEGGELLLETANVHLDAQYTEQNPDVTPGDYAAVIVTDTGSGMPAEVIERAYEPFFTTKEAGSGTGLGLSMVYGFMKQSRGHVKIYSELGHGTSVKLYLPRAEAERVASAENAISGEAAQVLGRETIVVVEDAAAVRRVAVNTLRGLGYHVLQAENGNAALAIVEGPEHIDLLFTDVIMPGGMSGVDLVREARKRRPDLRVLFTSGYSNDFVRRKSDPIVDAPLLGKPYRSQRLARTVREILDGAFHREKAAGAERHPTTA